MQLVIHAQPVSQQRRLIFIFRCNQRGDLSCCASQRQFLAALWNTGDGEELRFEVRDGP